MYPKNRFVTFQRFADGFLQGLCFPLAGAAFGLIPGFCDANLDASMNNFLTQMWKVMTFAGIIMAALGVASLVRTVSSIASGEQSQPGALGRGIGLLLGGIALAALKTLLGALGISTSV